LSITAFVLPYLCLYGVFWSAGAFERYLERLDYWLDPAAGTLHARQQRYAGQFGLLLATMRYSAAAVGWPMLVATVAAVVYALRRHGRIAAIVLLPVVGYYLIVIAQIGFVYSRFLFAPLGLVCILVGIAAAALWRWSDLPQLIRIGVPSVVLLTSLGYVAAIDAEMLTDSRYRAEQWFVEHVPRSASIGAFSHPQYLPRLHELGYATYPVEMTRTSFERPQPEYLVLTGYNYEDFSAEQQACLQDLLRSHLGYTPVATFTGRFLGSGRHWLGLAGWGTPVPGKISPDLTILRRLDAVTSTE
jgi:hypothetical protein